MLSLDTNTVILSLSALNIFVGVTFLTFHEKSNAIRIHLCGSMVSYGCAGLLIGFRDFLPPWFANVFANMVVGLSIVLIHRGAWIMVGKAPPDRVYLASVLALGAIYYQFTYPTPHIGIRLLSVSLFRVPYFVSTALALRSSRRFQAFWGVKALIWLLLIGACWYLLRGCFSIATNELAVLFRTGSMQSINFFIAAILNILIVLAFSRVDAEQAMDERNLAEEELRKREELLKKVLEVLPVGVWITDSTGTIIHGNPAGQKIWAGIHYVGPEKFGEYKGWWSGTNVRIKPEEWGVAKAISKGESSFEEKIDIECFDGTHKTILNWATPLLDSDNQIFGAIAVNQDISKRKRAEEALQESEELFRTLSSLAPSGIYFCDPKGNCRYTNPRWCEMAGLSLEEALGDGWTKGLHPEDRDFVFSNWQRMVESEGQWGLEYRFQTPTGKVTWVYGLATPQRNALGNIVAYVGINTDITERKEAEDTLRQITDRLDLALQAAKAGAWDWDVLTGHIEWSVQMFNIFGLNQLKNAASFELWESVLHPQDLEIAKSRIAQALEKQATLDSDYRIVLPDGQIRWINAVGKGQYDEQSRPIRMIGICIDITGRKLTEQAQRKAEQQLKLILDTVPALIWQKDSQGRYLHVNKAYCRIVGLSEKDILGKTDYDIFPKEIAQQYNSDDMKILNSGVPIFGIEEQHQKPSGERGWSYTNKMVWFDDQGNANGTIGFAIDITERKRAEEDLFLKNNTLDSVFKSAPYIMMLVNTEGRVVDINRSGVKFTGRSKDKLLGLLGGEVFGCMNSFDGQGCGKNDVCGSCPVRSRVKHTLETGEPVYEGQGRLNIMKDGDILILDLLVSTALVQSAEGRQVLVTIWDITDRVRAEEMLRVSEEKYRTVFENMVQGAFYQRNDGVLIDCNSALLEMLGLTHDQFLGKTSMDSIWKVINEDGSDLPGEKHPSMEALRTGKPVHDVTIGVFNPRKQDHVWLNINAIPLFRDGEDHPSEVFVTLHDITDRKKSEEAVLDSEQRFRTAFVTSPMAVVISTQKDGIWIDVNQAALDMFGYNREEVIGKSALATNLWVDLNDRQRFINNMNKGGEVRSQNIQLRRKDGRLIFASVSAKPMTVKGVKHILFITEDITEHKKTEDEKARLQTQLQQSQKMEAIGSLAGGIAHDLNNILFPISGLSEMLLDDMPPDNPALESIEQIYKSAQRGRDLVKQILAFSRQSHPQKLPIRLQPILKEVLKLSRATIPKNIDITSRIDADCGMVSADPAQVHQIVMNLITNAYHAVEENGGTIDIALNKTEFEQYDLLDFLMKPGKYACITISDTGIGIDQNLMDKIFDPYFTTKELGKGTGLGLSVVHGIVKAHGGGIRVNSEVHKGTTLNVYLPLFEGSEDIKDAVVIKKYPTGCERILLVDDEEPIAQMVKMMLERLDYHITVQTGSLDALAVFKANPGNFDLVICDRSMPNMTGEQLARELISIRPGIPIILCSGFCDETDEQRVKAMGIKGFLMKPVSTGDIATMVRKVLDESKGTTPQ